MSTILRTSEIILPHFNDLWRAADKYLRVVAEGGRNSGKSYTVSHRIVHNRMKYKSHALVIRKVDKTIRQSCRAQLIWAIEHMGVAKYWHWSSAPTGEMTLTYRPTGAKIFFEGANNPDNIKSWKTDDYDTTDIWIEEEADFRTQEDVSTIENSILRSKLTDPALKYTFFYTYNPPKRKQHWLNKIYGGHVIPPSTFVHHSDYRNNPHVSAEFVAEAEHVKETNQMRYEWEYLGRPIGSGVVPFNNLDFRTITDAEIRTFDNIRQGLDWGYAVDPVSFGRWHFDKRRKTAYCFGEIYGVKMSNDALAAKIRANRWNDTIITADSAEPKSVAEMNALGIKCKGAKKGQGSVEYGEKWLDDLERIVIDPNRCPNTAREFESIDYETDRNGNVIAKLMDKDNHSIDQARYAFEDDMMKSRAGVVRVAGV